MKRLAGWPIIFTGILSLSIGAAMHSGLDAGMITSGVSLILVGGWQECK